MKSCCKNCGYLKGLVEIIDENGNKKIFESFPGFVDESGNDLSPNLFKCYKFSEDGDVIDPNYLEDENCCDDFDANGVPYTNF